MEDLMRIALTNALSAAALGTVVAGLSLILTRRPAVVHCLWVVVLLKLVTPPLFEVSIAPIESEATAAVAETFAPADEADFEALDWEWAGPTEVLTVDLAGDPAFGAVAEPEPWPIDAALAWKVAGGVWLAGSLAVAALAGVRILRFQRRLREASPSGYLVEDEVAMLSAEMGLRRPPLVDFIDARTTPMLWGLGVRPRLILPRMLWKGLDGRSRTLLLTHELAHLKRGDHLLRFLELAVTVLYWWLPVVWWVRRALRDVEEQCCDAWVVWMFPDDARAYAETLLDTVDFLNPGAEPAPLLASGFGNVQHLRRRLTMVMKGTTPRTLGWKGSLGALALAGVLLPIGPTWAQKAPEGQGSITITADANADTVIVGEALEGDGDVVKFRAVADDGDIKTFNVFGPDEGAPLAGDVQTITVAAIDDDEKKDEKDKPKDDGDKKAELRKAMRFEFRGMPGEAKEGLKKAVEELKGKIKELESKDGKEEGAEVQVKALKAALEALQKMAAEGPATVDLKGGEGRRKEVFITRRIDSNDPKVLEARKQIDELQGVMKEKQKELSEAAKKLSEAHKKLAELQGHAFKAMPDVNARLAEVRNLQFKAVPRIAEGRAVLGLQADPKDKSRIDALEQKLDKVLKQLEGLKKPEAEGDKKE